MDHIDSVTILYVFLREKWWLQKNKCKISHFFITWLGRKYTSLANGRLVDAMITNLPLLSTDYGLFFVLIMSTNQGLDGLILWKSILFHSLDTSNFNLLDQDLHNNKLAALSSLVMLTQMITTQKNKIHGNWYDYNLNFDKKFANTKINLTKIKVIDVKFKLIWSLGSKIISAKVWEEEFCFRNFEEGLYNLL